MSGVSTIGLDLAKHVFQVHGSDVSGAVIFRKKLRRDQLLKFFATQPASTIAMEACASSHHWAREIAKLGHQIRLIAPAYVKPFVQRQKNDAADAEAICEAAQRPTMRFVAIKSEEQQAASLVLRARDLLVGQRTQIINAIRGHLAEFGIVVAKGPCHVAKLLNRMVDAPAMAQSILQLLFDQLQSLDEKIDQLDQELASRVKADTEAKRLMTIPGIGPIAATALVTLAPAAQAFKNGRDFAAWLGLTPLQRSTGGKQKLGTTSRMGERTLRRLLIIGASAAVRWARRRGSSSPWLMNLLNRKPPMPVTVALANKMARIVWALMARGGTYRAPSLAN